MCNDALDLNAKLITTEQKEYHESLKTGFTDIVNRLSKMFGETVGSLAILCLLFIDFCLFTVATVNVVKFQTPNCPTNDICKQCRPKSDCS